VVGVLSGVFAGDVDGGRGDVVWAEALGQVICVVWPGPIASRLTPTMDLWCSEDPL
jgi:hypothetical protein